MPFRCPFFLSAGALAGLLLGSGCARNPYFQPNALPTAALPLPASADSVRGATAGRQYARHGRLYRALVGTHYRNSWAAPVAAPVLRLAQAAPGGLRPGSVGGGFNSTSLSLMGKDGQAYVLRTIDKDPARATPRLLRGTFLVNVLRDNVSSTLPYAALAVPPLAAAVGVPHTSPRLYYALPNDPAFASDSLRYFRGQLALLEEKFSGPNAAVPGLGQGAVLSSTKAFAAVYASPNQRLDQAALLRARLFDALLGDWDRHPGQWNWAARPGAGAGTTALLPVPKDRDMTFYRVDDGALGWVLGHVLLRHWTSFGPVFPPASRLMWSGRYLDARGLNGLSRGQFRQAAEAMQRRLPDTLLARAVRRLPAAVFALEGPRIVAALRARRAALPALANDFYQQLARRPVVGGTNEAERFEIRRYRDSTVVVVRATEATAPLLFKRTFLPGETKTIQLHGLGGGDVFDITAAPGAGRPRLQVYGGGGTDMFSAQRAGRGVRFTPGPAPAKQAFETPPVE